MSNFGNRIALYCNDNTEYHTLLGGFRMQPQGIPGRCLMEKEKTIHEAQTYLAFDGEKEIDRINQIQHLYKNEMQNVRTAMQYRFR